MEGEFSDVRADRLISILLMLQRRGRLTAGTLAAELEVSERTITRDIEALGNAGVPIYAIRGRYGGFELWGGFRTELTGLSEQEAAALGLIGRAETAATLGLADDVARVDLKLAEALPAPLRADKRGLGDWLLIEDEPPSDAVVGAVRFLRVSVLRCRETTFSSNGRRFTVRPSGLVESAGRWFLVAHHDGAPRAWPVDGVSDLATTGNRFERPADFDLASAWALVRDVSRPGPPEAPSG